MNGLLIFDLKLHCLNIAFISESNMANTISLHNLIGLCISESHSQSMDLHYKHKGIHFSICKVDRFTNEWR